MKNKEIVYCPDMKCPNLMCLRHNKNTPFEKVIKRDTDFGRKKDTDVTCKFELMNNS